MQKNIYVGMEFETFQKLCDYLRWEFNGNHPDRMKNKLSEYMTFHKEGKSKIVIDEVFCDMKDMILKKKKVDGTYRFNIGDILETHQGKVEILKQIKIEHNKNEKHHRVGYKCKCLNCGYEFDIYEYNLLKGVGCGCCAGKIVVKGINDLWTTRPDLAKLLTNPDNGYKYSQFSGSKVDFKCPVCGEILKNKTISNIAMRGLGCYCKRTTSTPNRFMYWLLRSLNENFENEKSFNWSKRKRYDFYLPDSQTIVEMNGGYHYQEISFVNKKLKDVSTNDKLKYDLATSNGIKNYIVIECKEANFNYIKNNVLNSELKNIIPLDNVDWNYVKEKVYMSLIVASSEKWNDGIRDLDIIGNYIGLTSHNSIRKYINLARKYGYIKEEVAS